MFGQTTIAAGIAYVSAFVDDELNDIEPWKMAGRVHPEISAQEKPIWVLVVLLDLLIKDPSV